MRAPQRNPPINAERCGHMTLKSSLCKHLPSVRSPSLRCHHRYEYHGADHSLLYKFVLSPLAQASLALVPSWMAPNLVTAIGLGLTTACYALIYFTAPGMISVDTPAWVFITAALGVFLYQTLDNIDGKQVSSTILYVTFLDCRDGTFTEPLLCFPLNINYYCRARGPTAAIFFFVQ